VNPLPEGILPPLVTPFRADEPDHDALRFNVERLNSTRLAGYVVLGSNGEGVYLDEDEAVRVVDRVVETSAADKFIVVGTGRESTRRTLSLSRRVIASGARALLVAPPSYYRDSMTDVVLEEHFRRLADSVNVPVILYNVPKFVPVALSARLVLSLARHPNIRGIKDTSGDLLYLGTILAGRPSDFRVYVGSASLLLAGLSLGADGGIHALANVAPDECVELFDLGRDPRNVGEGNVGEARLLQYRLLPVNQSVTALHGVPGLKAAMDLRGYRGGEPRRPLLPLAAPAIEDIRKVLVSAKLIGA
jgi:4-hydroxy-2-oxoglutarate aldolase